MTQLSDEVVERVRKAIFDPGLVVGLRSPDEPLHHWQARAVLEAAGLAEVVERAFAEREAVRLTELAGQLDEAAGDEPRGHVRGLLYAASTALEQQVRFMARRPAIAAYEAKGDIPTLR